MKLFKHLLRNKPLIAAAVLILLLMTCAISAYLGDFYALRNTTFRNVSVGQLASAMRQDDYYASYRENTVIFSAQVAAMHGNTVQFVTDDVYSVSCIINSNAGFRTGDTIRIAAEAYSADRQPHGVLIKQCAVL